MAYPAIGIVEELLVEWFSAIASWNPSGGMLRDGCTSCADTPAASALAIGDWPHDLVHLIVANSGTMAEVMREQAPSAHEAEQLVLDLLRANARDAHDIFDSCVAQPLSAYLRAEVEGLIENLRLPA